MRAPRRLVRSVLVGAALAFAASCGESTPPLVPTTITLSLPSLTLDAIGATQTLTANVKDQNGNALATANVTWTSSNSAVVSITGGSTAQLTALAAGSATVTATAGAITQTATVTVAQLPAAPAKLAGDAQTGTVGAALGTALQFKVVDRLGNAIANTPVTFTLASGGSVSPATPTSAADGTVSVTWTLGTTAGTQTLTATAQGGSAGVSFSATANAGPAALISLNAGAGQSATAGSAVATAPSVKVIDSFGNAKPGITVTFTVASGGGTITGGTQVTNASGIAQLGAWTLGTVAGSNTLSVNVTGLSSIILAATGVAGPPTRIAVNAGNAQSAAVSSAVAIRPAVVVTDANNNGVKNIAITFAVATGGGSITGATATTDNDGIATVGSWTLGATAGANTLTATASGVTLTGNPITFTATATSVSNGSGFNIELRYLSTGSPTQVAAFTQAAARWQRIITADLLDASVVASAGSCGSNAPALNEVIDDLVIYVTFEAIDGVGNILGSAGPCFIRTADNLPVVGRMRFDIADLANMEANGTLNSVILHEMGHVLGIGSLWNIFGLLANPSLPNNLGADTRFTGSNGTAGFDLIGGSSYTGGAKVPVENAQGGSGTRDAHWRESVLANELMTGFISSTTVNPLSVLTIRSLQDFGYVVDVSQADSFFLTLTAALRAPGNAVRLVNDVDDLPIHVIDERGRIVRTLVRPPRE